MTGTTPAGPVDALANAPIIGSAVIDERGAIVAPGMRDFDELARQMEQWLAPRMPGVRDIRISNLTYPRGSGQSHETILFDTAWTERGRAVERGLVVRIKPTTFRVFLDDMFVQEFELMRSLRDKVPVAEVLWFEEDPTLLGAPFFVMERLSGRVPVSIPSYMETGWLVDSTPEQRHTAWEGGVRALATLQTLAVEDFAFLDRPEVGDGFAQEWDRYSRFLDMILEVRSLPYHQAVWKRLAETAPTSRPPGLVWGDARLGNLMFAADYSVEAMMDWEQPSLGGALQDLGWWLFTDRTKITARGGIPLEGLGSREETIAIWESVTGIGTSDLEWWEAYAGFKMSCLHVNMLDMKGEVPPGGDYSTLWNIAEAGPLLGM